MTIIKSKSGNRRRKTPKHGAPSILGMMEGAIIDRTVGLANRLFDRLMTPSKPSQHYKSIGGIPDGPVAKGANSPSIPTPPSIRGDGGKDHGSGRKYGFIHYSSESAADSYSTVNSTFSTELAKTADGITIAGRALLANVNPGYRGANILEGHYLDTKTFMTASDHSYGMFFPTTNTPGQTSVVANYSGTPGVDANIYSTALPVHPRFIDSRTNSLSQEYRRYRFKHVRFVFVPSVANTETGTYCMGLCPEGSIMSEATETAESITYADIMRMVPSIMCSAHTLAHLEFTDVVNESYECYLPLDNSTARVDYGDIIQAWLIGATPDKNIGAPTGNNTVAKGYIFVEYILDFYEPGMKLASHAAPTALNRFPHRDVCVSVPKPLFSMVEPLFHAICDDPLLIEDAWASFRNWCDAYLAKPVLVDPPPPRRMLFSPQ